MITVAKSRLTTIISCFRYPLLQYSSALTLEGTLRSEHLWEHFPWTTWEGLSKTWKTFWKTSENPCEFPDSYNSILLYSTTTTLLFYDSIYLVHPAKNGTLIEGFKSEKLEKLLLFAFLFLTEKTKRTKNGLLNSIKWKNGLLKWTAKKNCYNLSKDS